MLFKRHWCNIVRVVESVLKCLVIFSMIKMILLFM